MATASGAPARSGGVATWGGIGALLLGLLAKGKGLLVALKALPFAKLLLTGGSMAASVALYAMRGGWAFALGLVLMIFIHEMGHGVAMKRAGVEAGWPVFIPFFGAMIAMKGRPNHPRVEADIAYGGPVAGTGVCRPVSKCSLASLIALVTTCTWPSSSTRKNGAKSTPYLRPRRMPSESSSVSSAQATRSI